MKVLIRKHRYNQAIIFLMLFFTLTVSYNLRGSDPISVNNIKLETIGEEHNNTLPTQVQTSDKSTTSVFIPNLLLVIVLIVSTLNLILLILALLFSSDKGKLNNIANKLDTIKGYLKKNFEDTKTALPKQVATAKDPKHSDNAQEVLLLNTRFDSILQKIDDLNSKFTTNSQHTSSIENLQEQLTRIEETLLHKNHINQAQYLLDIYFKDVAKRVSEAYQIAEQKDPSFKSSIEEYVRDLSFLFGFVALSRDVEKLKIAYEIINMQFKDTNVKMLLPFPGETYNDDTMIIDKRYEDNQNIHSIVQIGAIVDNIIIKALVNVGQ